MMVSIDTIRWTRQGQGLAPARRRDIEPTCHVQEIGEGAGVHLSHHASTMRLDGDLADVELAADLLVEEPRNHELHDFPLATGERCISRPDRSRLLERTQPGPALRDRVVYGGE